MESSFLVVIVRHFPISVRVCVAERKLLESELVIS